MKPLWLLALLAPLLVSHSLFAQTYAYAPDGWSAILGFSENKTTGALTSIAGSPFPFGSANSGPLLVALTPNGKFAYIGVLKESINCTGGISAYSINAGTGALTLVPGSASPTLAVSSIVVHPSGHFLYSISFNCSSPSAIISAFSINGATGALSLLATYGPFATSGDLWRSILWVSFCTSR